MDAGLRCDRGERLKQLVQDYKTGTVRVEEVPTPVVRPGGVLVRTGASLVSAGTERAVVSFGRASMIEKARKRPDLVRQVLARLSTDGPMSTFRAATGRLEEWVTLGYSSAGVVVAVGAGVDRFRVGDTVACAGGGFAVHAEIVWVPQNLVVPIPSALPMEEAAFTTVGAIALHGVHRAKVQPGYAVGVIGLGLLGLLTVQILRAYGCRVIGVDVREPALARATASGAERAVLASTDLVSAAAAASDGHGLDAVIVTAATESSDPVAQAGSMAREGGTICIVGDVGMDIPRRTYYEKELDVVVARSYGFGRYDATYEEHGIDYPIAHARWTINRNLAEVVRLLASGALRTNALVASRVPIAEAPAAYEALVSGALAGAAIITYPSVSPPDETPALPPSPAVATREPIPGKVGVGIIGAGAFSRGVLLPALRKAAHADLRAVAAARGTHAAEAASRFGAARAASDPREILDDPSVRLVMVATRHDQHARLAAEALKAGKSVFVEKPLCLSLEELEEVTSVASSSPGLVMVGFNRRFAPFVREVERHFKDRRSPLVMSYRINAGPLPATHWLRDPIVGGGRIRGEACHFVDLLAAVAGAPITQVYATAADPASPDDHFVATLDFEEGSRGTVHYVGDGPAGLAKERIEVLGADRAAVIENFRRLELITGTRRRVVRRLSQDKGHVAEVDAVVKAVREGAPSPIPFRAIENSTRATLALLESLRSNAPVSIPRPSDGGKS